MSAGRSRKRQAELHDQRIRTTLRCSPMARPRKAVPSLSAESADVAYRLARMAEEAAASLPIAPNAHEVADAADYTAVPRAQASRGRARRSTQVGMMRASGARRARDGAPQNREAPDAGRGRCGLRACAVYTQDHRGEGHTKAAQRIEPGREVLRRAVLQRPCRAAGGHRNAAPRWCCCATRRCRWPRWTAFSLARRLAACGCSGRGSATTRRPG